MPKIRVHPGIAPDSIGSTELEDDSVGSQHVRDDAISYAAQIKDDVIGSEHISDNAIGSGVMVADDVIGSEQIDDDSIHDYHIADDAIGSSAMIDADVVRDYHIADDAIGSQHLANNAVSYPAQIKDNIIGHGELTTGLQGTIAAGSIPPANSIGTTELANDSVGSEHIRDGAIAYGTQVKNRVIGSQHIAYDNIGTFTNVFGSFTTTAANPTGLAYNSEKHRLFNANHSQNYIYEIGTINGNAIGSFPIPGASTPTGLAFASDKNRLWSVCYSGLLGGYYIYEIGTTTGNKIGSLPSPCVFPGGLAFASDNHHLWHGDVVSDYIFEIGTTIGSAIGSFKPSDAGPVQGVAFASDKNRLWYTNDDSNFCYELGTTTGNLIGSFKLPDISPRGLVFASDKNKLWYPDDNHDYIFEMGTVARYSHIRDNAIDWRSIKKNSIGSQHIIDDAVGSSELAAGAVAYSDQIIDDRIGSEHIGNNAISYEAQIKANIVGYGKLTTGLQGTYIKRDGTGSLLADWDAGDHKITARQLESDIATGTQPLIVASTTMVDNFNADAVDDKHVGSAGNKIPLLDSSNIWSADQFFGSVTKLHFRNFGSVYMFSNAPGELTIMATNKVSIGTPGDTELGDGTERDIFPNTDYKMNLGQNDHRFNNLFVKNGTFSGDAEFAGDTIIGGELKGGRMLIHGGEGASITSAAMPKYLRALNAMIMTATRCYCMPRDGSIVGVSATFNEDVHTTNGRISVCVYKNGNNVFQANYNSLGTGDHKLYGTQSRNIGTFIEGDLVALAVERGSWEGTTNDWQALCELQLDT